MLEEKLQIGIQVEPTPSLRALAFFGTLGDKGIKCNGPYI